MLTACFLIFIIIWSLFFRNSKLLNGILVFTLFVLFAFERSDEDYQSYLSAYNSVGRGSVFELLGYEPSFFLFCTVGNKYNLSFDFARGIICVIEILAIVSTIRLFTNKISMVLSLFLIFPAMFDTELFRWLAGMCLVIFAFPYLIRGANKYDYIMYGGLVILATSLHTSCIFFLFYLMMILKNEKMIIIIVLTIFLVGVWASQTSLLYTILSVMPINADLMDKFQEQEQSNIFGVLALFLKSVPIFVIGFLAYAKWKNNRPLNTDLISNYKIIFSRGEISYMGTLLLSKIFIINIITLLLVMLSIYTPQTQRLFHVVLFFNYIAIVYVSGQKKWRLGIFCTFVMSILLLLAMLYLSSKGTMPVFLSHFKEGFFVNFFQTIVK